MWFILAGGFPMIVILVVGAIALVGAVRFAITPSRAAPLPGSARAGGRRDLVRRDVRGPAHRVGERSRRIPRWPRADNLPIVLLVGLGESLTPLILGAAIVAGAALLVAVGLRRLPPEFGSPGRISGDTMAS
jgi:hypothetical protein